MKYLKIWVVSSIICIIGISILAVGYYLRNLLGLLPGAIIGIILGVILIKWSRKKKHEIDGTIEGTVVLLEMDKKNTLKMKKDVETLMNVSGPHIKTTKWYWTEYKYIQDRLKEVKYQRKSPHSMENASTSYRLIRGDLDRLKRSIEKHVGVGMGSKKKTSDSKGSDDSISLLDKDKFTKTFGEKDSLRTKDTDELEEQALLNEKSELEKKRLKRSTRFIRFLKRKKGRPVPPEQKNAVAGYELEEHVDTHGVADVYFGKDRYGRKVAVKVPSLDEGEKWDLMTMAEFKADAKEWNDLEHENIVKLSNSGFGPAPFVAMERVDGGGLDDLMKDHVFNMDEVINIFTQILKGVSYAHKKKVIHMDLKPENILFDETGTAKISDWCLDNFLASRYTDKLKDDNKRLAYSAPEQIKPKEFGKPDKSTDVFRLGVIFYEILTKKKPFYDQKPKKIKSMITDENPLPPSSLNPEVPAELDSIIMRALEKKKKNRWQSADDMYDKLAELMKY